MIPSKRNFLHPFCFSYFVMPSSHEGSVEKAMESMLREPQMVMAVNGWVMGDDPLRNFAEGNVVLLRCRLCWR